MAHARQSRPDSGLGAQVEVPKMFQVVPSSLGSDRACMRTVPQSSKGCCHSRLRSAKRRGTRILPRVQALSLSLARSPSDARAGGGLGHIHADRVMLLHGEVRLTGLSTVGRTYEREREREREREGERATERERECV